MGGWRSTRLPTGGQILFVQMTLLLNIFLAVIRSINYFLKKLLVSKGKVVFSKLQCNSETWKITSLLPKLALVKLMQHCYGACPIYCICKNEIPSHVFFDPVKKTCSSVKFEWCWGHRGFFVNTGWTLLLCDDFAWVQNHWSMPSWSECSLCVPGPNVHLGLLLWLWLCHDYQVPHLFPVMTIILELVSTSWKW